MLEKKSLDLKHILTYLKEAKNAKLIYKNGAPKEITAYSDVSWNAKQNSDERSTNG